MEKIKHETINTNGINIHIATTNFETTTSPTILFLHGFPQLWYCWRHQLLSLSSHGYRCIAPDLRGYGDSDAPESPLKYTPFHVVGDIVGLLDSIGVERVFVVGHDWGAVVGWYFGLFRPDRVRGLVNMSIAYFPRSPNVKPVEKYREIFGSDFYICRFQEPGEIEEDFAQADTAKLMRTFLTSREPAPPCIPKELGFRGLPDCVKLPSWLSEEDVNYYASKFNEKGFIGGLNYYRSMDLAWELTAPWTGAPIKVPAKFIVGDLDISYNIPGVKDYLHGGGFKKFVPRLEDVVVLEGVAHYLQEEKPDEVTAHIHEFIKKFAD